MRTPRSGVWFLILAAGLVSVSGQEEEPRKLPDQYAQAVLQVEGMI